MNYSKLSDEGLKVIIDIYETGCNSEQQTCASYVMAKELLERREADKLEEPIAYMTYKGYLLHAGDPKVEEYSEPTPLYDSPVTCKLAPHIFRELVNELRDYVRVYGGTHQLREGISHILYKAIQPESPIKDKK